MHENIPGELRSLPQWVSVGPNKIPINPRTGDAADPTNPHSWGTFDEARQLTQHVGFVLTKHDPYTIIDLDNSPNKPATPEQLARHKAILEQFESYTERSVSGNGYHIIVRGSLPAGVRRDNVEMYSDARYMICTGDVVRDAPIEDYQHLLNGMFTQMQPHAIVDLVDVENKIGDSDLVEMATRAANGDKFLSLCRGEWQQLGYESQSEADHALLAMLAFYTPDNAQVRRLFRYSALGKRDKAQRNDKYIDRTLEKIRAKEPPRLDLSSFTQAATVPAAPKPKPKPPAISSIELPPGLVGEVARYIYSTNVRPVMEVALAGSLGFLAGICGRGYNVSGTGLNQYLILLAPTGSGKEGAATGIDRLVSAVQRTVPVITDFVGPAVFASGQGLIKTLDENPCFVSVLGEIGLTLQQMCDPRANGAQVALRRVLLDLYNKSGKGQVLRSSVYSDKEKNTKMVASPSLTILGEGTPETFYSNLSQEHIAEGLIPRFTIIEYRGQRPPRNRDAGASPDDGLVQRLKDLATAALSNMNNHTVCDIRIEQGALALLDQFDADMDAKINGDDSTALNHLWNRAHLKALKMGGLVAVGCNAYDPVITTDIAKWAIHFINEELTRMAKLFENGEIGQSVDRLEDDVLRFMQDYIDAPVSKRRGYKVPSTVVSLPGVVPFAYLRRRARRVARFASHRQGSTKALKDAMEALLEAGLVQQVPTHTAVAEYGVNSPLYVMGNEGNEGN